MRYLFASAQLPGHLDWGGYLHTAAELQRRGHQVLWATGRAVAPFLQQAGITAHFLHETGWRWPPPPPLQPDPAIDAETLRHQRALRALDQWLEVPRVEAATGALIDIGRTFQPDVIVSEVFLSAAGLAAEALGKHASTRMKQYIVETEAMLNVDITRMRSLASSLIQRYESLDSHISQTQWVSWFDVQH